MEQTLEEAKAALRAQAARPVVMPKRPAAGAPTAGSSQGGQGVKVVSRTGTPNGSDTRHEMGRGYTNTRGGCG